MNFVDPFGLIWVTVGSDYHSTKNTGRFLLNRVTNLIGSGMDPSVAGADPKEYLGLKRDVIQEWVPDPNPENSYLDDAFEIGTQRRIEQTWIQKHIPGPDETFITSPGTHYFYPQVNDWTYDYYGKDEDPCK